MQVSVTVKKQVIFKKLGFNQGQMYKIGMAAVESVVHRVQRTQDSNDQVSPPLTKRYAIFKSKTKGRKASRDLTYSGDMLRNLTARTVTSDSSKANLSTRHARQAGNAADTFFRTKTGSSWLAFSPTNERETIDQAFTIILEAYSKLLSYGSPLP